MLRVETGNDCANPVLIVFLHKDVIYILYSSLLNILSLRLN